MTDFLTDKNQNASDKGNNIINDTNDTNDTNNITNNITKTMPELDRNILKKRIKKIRQKK